MFSQSPLSRALTICITALVLICFGIINESDVYAGCHYGPAGRAQTHRFNSSSQSALFDSQSPQGHARDFQFLGQWIYEAGEIKYVPWQSSSPCKGPNCRVDKDPDQPSTNVPSQRVVRPLLLDFVVVKQSWHDPSLLVGFVIAIDVSGFKGYPHEHEYPP